MLTIEKWKIVLILLLSAMGFLYAVPNVLPAAQQEWLVQHVPSGLPSRTVNLGLDLRGGSHLLLEADTRAVIKERIESMSDAVRGELRKADMSVTDFQVHDDGFSYQLNDAAKDTDAAKKITRDVDPRASVDVSDTGLVTLILNEMAINDIKKQVIAQSIEIVRRRIDESGTKEPLIQQQGSDRIVVQLPGVDDPGLVKELLGKTAKMGFHLVDMDNMYGDAASAGSVKLPLGDEPGRSIVIKKRVMVSGEMLTDARPSFDQSGKPVVSFRFDSVGAKRFCSVTRDNLGKPFAIVLDNSVISAPVIQSEICGGQGQISGNFTVEESTKLAVLLRSGALPAPLTVIEERSVGPTLGSDSIAAGKHASAVAFVLVFLLMAVTYGLFGIFANIALICNIVFILAVLSIMQATLTLPGIAGIILTIGIAVDANVLIYERIREEIRRGRSTNASIDTGYRLALGTIVDSNLVTLIVALILFSFGHGPIKGFAVTMCIGIVTSMFSAIMLTRLLVLTWLRKKRPSTLHL